MVGMNRAALIAQIGALTTPKVTEGKSIDFAGAIENFNRGFDKGQQIIEKKENKQNAQDLIDALTGEHPDDAALIKSDPFSYAKMLQDNANAERDQQYKMDYLGQQFENALALEDKRNANAIGLAKLAAELKGNQTTGMQNIEYLKTLGYSPEEAAALYYGGQNPNFSFPAFGEKGFNKADENMGKNYAEDLESYRSMTSKIPELEATVDKLSELGQNATYTKAGQALDLVRKELGFNPRQEAIDRKEYISIVDNQILPLLRDTFGAQFTEREGNTLKQTLGDVNATPEEKNAVLRSFINQKKKSVESQVRKLQSYSNGLATNGIQTLMPNYKEKYGLE